MLFHLRLFIFVCAALCPAVLGQYRFDTWSTDNGLPQNGVRQITQTPEGYLWFTTFDGLVRFDGVRFTIFNKSNTKGIINNRFTGLFGDLDGTLYATTTEDGVLTIFRNGEFSSFTSDEVPGNFIKQIERGPDGELRFLSEDPDRTSRSWYRLNGRTFELIEKEPKFDGTSVIVGRHGVRWTVTAAGVTELKDGNETFIPIDLESTRGRVDAFEDSRGNLWLGENRIHRLRDGQLLTFGERAGLPETVYYHSFWEESPGNVWCASGGLTATGVGLIQFQDDEMRLWGSDYGLTTSVQELFRDREGTVWLATNRGLSRRRRQVIQSLGVNEGLDHSEVYPIFRDREGTIWVGTPKGLSIYRNGRFETLDLRPASPDTPANQIWKHGRMSVQSLFEDDNGKIWAGLNGSIYLIHKGTAKMLLDGYHVFAINNDRHGNIWAATNKGLLRFNDYRIAQAYSTADGLPNEMMINIFEDSKGTLWFGGYGGLSKFENGHFTNYTVADGLTGNYVRSIYEDSDGTLWIGTYDEGMSRFRDGRFVSFKEADGLYNSGVFAIEEDEAGYFWISSNRGIYRVKRQELNDFADGKIDRINSLGYGKEDGMLSTECNGGRQPASLKADDGKIWFPTQDGISVIDPLAQQPNPLPPAVVIEDVLVEREAVAFRGGTSIEPGQKDIEIRYTGISLIKPEQIKFQYKLEGHDADWIDAGTRRTAYYSYLPPGQYTFRVKAANSDGVWNQEGASVPIELKPFFYQTTSFYLVAGLALALGLLVIWKLSVHQLEARERRLSRMVKARTEELAQANENLEKLANSDGLTKIGNRRRFESFLTDEWHRAVRFKTEISLIMLDIDHFKLYNDTYGHQAGDECLQRVAEVFAETIKRPTDLVARFGGEEFAIILGGTDANGAMQIAELAVNNLRSLRIAHKTSETGQYLTVSVGLATTFAGFDICELDLIRMADQALYEAKVGGRDRICVSGHPMPRVTTTALPGLHIAAHREIPNEI